MILCCGDALIDMLPRRSETGDACFAPYPGGAIFNTAIALGRLGAPVTFFSGLSRDHFGTLLSDALTASHVQTRHVVFSARPTTLAFVRLVDGQATYLFYDENTAGRMLEEADLPTIGDDVTAMLFGGISLISEPCGSAYEALMTRERDRRVVMLDPNIRPDFTREPEKHKARIRRMAAMTDILKISDEDLFWLGGGKAFDTSARQWLDHGARIVVVTRGREGAIAFTDKHEVSVPAGSVEVVDTVGAGDTFNAGLLASLCEQGLLSKQAIAEIGEDALRHALELGVRAAAVTVSRAGANPPWRRELA